MSGDHLDTDTLAERWGIHPNTLEQWRTKGIGPLFLKINSRVLYRKMDIERYEVECLRQSTSVATQPIPRGIVA